jgi:hypothetical protein
MLDYILFEKKSENDRPVWNEELVRQFCTEREIDYKEITEEVLVFVVKVSDPIPDSKFRLFEVTETISFILRDDPSLDEFLEVEMSPNIKESTCSLEELKIDDEKGI